MDKFLITGRVCGWDDDCALIVEADNEVEARSLFIDSLRFDEDCGRNIPFDDDQVKEQIFVNTVVTLDFAVEQMITRGKA